jgi:REP element-mobilizing transposase RayT
VSDKFNGKYRGQTFRLKNWDYSSQGLYFITICTQDRENYLGEIYSGKMCPSEIGEIAEKFWVEIEKQFDFIHLDEFVIMPNHIHGILEICNSEGGNDNVYNCRDAINRVPTIVNPTNVNPVNGGFAGEKNPMFHKNISRVIRWYKGRCSFEMRKLRSDFKWQSLFHDHVIRNEESYQRIRQYIKDNPKNWGEDTFNNSNS